MQQQASGGFVLMFTQEQTQSLIQGQTIQNSQIQYCQLAYSNNHGQQQVQYKNNQQMIQQPQQYQNNYQQQSMQYQVPQQQINFHHDQIQEIQLSQEQYPQNPIEQIQKIHLENQLCLCITYEIFWLICIVLEYLGCQSLSAANLFISIQVFMLTSAGLLYFVKTLQNITFKWITFGSHFFLLCLSYILNIAAFALSAKYPSFLGAGITPGNCYYYGDEMDALYNYQPKYTRGEQYPILIMYIIQFFYASYFLYQQVKRDKLIFQHLRGLAQIGNVNP